MDLGVMPTSKVRCIRFRSVSSEVIHVSFTITSRLTRGSFPLSHGQVFLLLCCFVSPQHASVSQ